MNQIRPLTQDDQDYLKDESRTIGTADTISFPTNEADIVEIVSWCHEHAIPLTIQGARTGVAAGAVPQGGHVMNLSKLNRITACAQNGAGFFFDVEPGLSLIELNKAIDTKKFDTTGWSASSLVAYHVFLDAPAQFYPPDPTESTCSLGGMVSCNASGARSFLYGSVRNHVVGLRVVLSTGDIVCLRRGETMANGRTLTLQTVTGATITLDLPTYQMPETKNASGYFVEDNMDAIDLFIGADGTLGVVSQITIATAPLPEEIWGVSCFFDTEEQAVDFVIAVRKSAQHMAALEYFDPHALDVLRTQKETGTAFKQLPAIDPRYHACVYCELHCQSVSQAQEALFHIGHGMRQVQGDPHHSWVARNQSDLHLLQFFRHAVPESVNMIVDQRKKAEPIITKLGSDMSVPDSALKDVFALYKSTLAQAGLEHAIWGHIGNNHLHVNILATTAQDYHQGKALFEQWAKETTHMGGAVSAEHGVGKLKAHFLEVMYGAQGIDQMRQLKTALDSHHIFNLGNLFAPEEVR